MGLDITLGALVFVCAVRGWFKGFLKQAIPLGALVGCVYLADPLRDLARPYARKSFPSIGPDVMDRLLWWSGVAVSYIVVAGIGLSIVKSMRKRTYGDPEPNRADQGAGFTLGALKGAVLAAFLAAAFAKYGATYLAAAPYVSDQAKTSRTLAWSDQYRPAEVLWTSAPVQSFVKRIKSRGLWLDGEPKPEPRAAAPEVETAKAEETGEPLKTASGRPKTLSLPRLDPDSPDFGRDLEDQMRRVGLRPD